MSSTDAAFDLGEAVAVLERTPRVLQAWLSGLPDAWARANEGDGTWSAYDVVGHLIDGEETDWIPRARIILAQGTSLPFTPFDRFRHLEPARQASLEERLVTFAALRADNLGTLRGWRLTPGQLALPGEHPELGRVTLAQLLATWAAHDLDHLMQIAKVMGRRYAGAVGPWRAYLRVARP